MHNFLQERRLQEKLTDPRGKNKLMGASLDTRGFLLLLPSLDMQPKAYSRFASCSSLRGVGVCSPRPAGHSEFCKYSADSLTGCIALAADGAGPRRCTAGVTPASVRTRDKRTEARTGRPLYPRNG